MPEPQQRISPVVFPQTWELPARPEQGPPAALDAHRQTEFQLRGDLRLLQELTSAALERGERLRDLSVTRPSLEDVYLELTGDG